MANVKAKYLLKVPSILMNGDEVLNLEPIKIMTDFGEATIYPPGSKERKPRTYVEPKKTGHLGEAKLEVTPPSSFWEADTLWIDVETEVTPELSRGDHIKLDRDVHYLVLRFLRLLRRKLPEMPFPLPTDWMPRIAFEWESEQPGQLAGVAPTTPSVIRVVPPEAGTTVAKWRELEQQLNSGVETELWEDFIVDAKVALQEDDLNRATLYAAIGCEIFVKGYTEKAARNAGISQKFWKYLESRRPRVSDFYDSVLHLVKGHSLRAENLEMYKLVERLNRARNDIMHRGKLSLPKDKTNRLRKVNKLREDIQGVGQVISWVCGL